MQNEMLKSNKFLLGVIAVLLVALSLTVSEHTFITKNGNASTGQTAAPAEAKSAANFYDRNPVAKIAKECSPAVVNIDTETMVKQTPFPFANDPFFKEFFGKELDQYNRMVPMRGKGSGFIVDAAGYILTNNHVVEGADKITVTLLDGRHFPAKLIGRDPTYDLAVIQIKAPNLPVLALGDSDETEVGEWVVAIGNPLGFENTVTAGVISGKNRTLQAADVNFQGFMQTDAAINPGNSGGPLINLDGRAVGINTAIVPYAQGIGFAVPVNMAKQVMDDLIKHGEVKRGWLGVMLQTITPGFAETYKIPTSEGAIISDIVKGSPAERSGLRRGDVVVGVDGKKVKSSQDAVLYVRGKLMGENVKLEIYRDGKKQTVEVKLGEIPGKEGTSKISKPQDSKNESKTSKRIGATVCEITPAVKEEYKLTSDSGVVIVEVENNTIASELGLRAGDQVLEVNRKQLSGISDWESSIGRDPKTLVLLVQRSGQTLFFTYKK